MSTIIKPARGLALAALVLVVWTMIMLAMPFVGPKGRQVAVVGDPARAMRAIAAAGGKIVEVRRGAILAQGSAGFPARLYAAGAPLVLEGRLASGCFPAKAGA